MTIEEIYNLKQFQRIFVFNTPYLYYDKNERGIFLLDQRKDYDYWLFLQLRDFKFISLRKNVAEIVIAIDKLEGRDKIIMKIYYQSN